MFTPLPESIILETKHWRITHNRDARLEGYLMLGTLEEAYEFSDISSEGLAEFGEIVSLATSAIRKTFSPKHVLVGRYGVMPGHRLHLHLVPVYDWLDKRMESDERYSFLDTLYSDEDSVLRYDAADYMLYTWRELCERADESGLPEVDLTSVVNKLKRQIEKDRLDS